MTNISNDLLNSATSGDLDTFATVLSSVPVNRLGGLGKDVSFRQAVDQLVPIALHAPTPLQRLKALALIGRADSTTQRKQQEIAAAANHATAVEPPPLDAEAQEILKSEDRYYISLVIARAEANWKLVYAARSLLNESSLPKTRDPRDVRSAFAEILFEGVPDLSAAFRILSAAVPGSLHENPGTKDADLSRARRLARLLAPIEDAVRNSIKENGGELAASFNEMLQMLVYRHQRPTVGLEGEDAAGGAVDAVLSLLGTLLRTRFSLAGQTETYKAIGQLKHWHKTQTWPKSSRLARQRLAQSLREAITLRAQTGKPSRELLAVLIQLVGDRRTVEKQLLVIAEQPDITPEVQDWLRAGGTTPQKRFENTAAEEAGLRDVDSLIANTLVRAQRLRTLVDDVTTSGREQVNEPLGGSNKQMVNFARAIANDVIAISGRRSMTLLGEVGDIVTADPKRHRSLDGRLIQTEFVRIEAPGVERIFPNGTSEIVVPAQVSQVEAKRK